MTKKVINQHKRLAMGMEIPDSKKTKSGKTSSKKTNPKKENSSTKNSKVKGY